MYIKNTVIIRITILLGIFLNCCNNRGASVPINQIFLQDDYTIHNIMFDNAHCQLDIYKDDNLILQKNLGMWPHLVDTLNGDTLYVARLRFGPASGDSAYGRPEFISTENHLVIAVRNYYFTHGTLTGGKYVVDYAYIINNSVVMTGKNVRDTISLNKLLFDGEEFYTSHDENGMRVSKQYHCTEKILLDRYLNKQVSYAYP